MPSLGPWELLIVLVIVVIIFGVGKLPEIGGALGKGIKEFRTSAKDDGSDDVDGPDSRIVTSRTETTTVRNEPVKEEL
jgi:sec-independent protein translocase protein TatA